MLQTSVSSEIICFPVDWGVVQDGDGMWLAKPSRVVCTWRGWQRRLLLWNPLVLPQRRYVLGGAGSAVRVWGPAEPLPTCPQYPTLRVPLFSWRSLRKHFTAWELCCSCDPSKIRRFSTYWTWCSHYCGHHVGELCLRSCNCTLTPKVSPGGITQQLLLPGGAARLTRIPPGSRLLSAGFWHLSHPLQPLNPANMQTKILFSLLSWFFCSSVEISN